VQADIVPLSSFLCSAHEYTASNAKFAASVEPGNEELMKRVAEISKLRERGEPTVPSLMGVEKKTNPFLRCDVSDEIRQNVGVVSGDSDDVAFGKVRKAKDKFRG
jgi:hydroxyacylglutathione hydrolase